MRSDHLTVAYAPRGGATGAFAVTIANKVARTAVLRHRVKRALFTEIAFLQPYPFDVVVSVRVVPQDNATRTLRVELRTLLERINHV